MFLMNSGVRGNGDSKKSLLSTAKLFTFHLPNSLDGIIGETTKQQYTVSIQCIYSGVQLRVLYRRFEMSRVYYNIATVW